MELKQGYKQTEVGLIPSDWEVKLLDELTDVIDPHPSHRAPISVSNGIPFLGIGDLNENGEIIKDNYRVVPSCIFEEHKLRYNLNEGLLGLGRVASIGKVIKFKNDKVKYTISPTMGVLRPKGCPRDYLFQILKSQFTVDYFKKIMSGSTRSSVGMIVLRKIPIPIPKNVIEQTLIATALTDMDALISQTEKLIEKKKAIKQGAMQELLKPKEGWVTKKFTDVVNYIHGKAHEQFIVENGKYQVVNSKFISTEGTVKKYSDVSFLTAKKGDVLTVLSDLPNGKALAKCFYVEEDKKYAVNQRICIWRSTSDYPKFLFYFLNRHKYFMAINDGVSQTHILNGHIEKFYIEIPENYSEQQSIAETLWDIDKELQLIETKLTKLKQQKQGMMQALLTGKIRLVS